MFVVTGNRLLDGIVVYLASAHRWVENIQDARIYETEAEAKEALSVQSDVIISLDVVPVERGTGDTLLAQRLREKIRANGPTIQPFQNINLERPFAVHSD